MSVEVATIAIAVDVVSSIRNAIEAVKVWYEIKDKKRVIEKLSEQSAEETRKEFSIQVDAHNISLLISEEILITFQKRIKECETMYIKVLDSRDDFLEEQITNATNAYIKCYCRELNRINQINGFIPDGQMKRFWEQHSCFISSPFNK